MAESKRTFQAAKMERDLDERLIQPGAYRDAVNISISSSEDANVGSIENIKGNNLIDNLDAGISQSVIGSFTNGQVIGTYAHPEENKIYYFVTGDDGSGVFEYDTKEAIVNTIIIESQVGIIDDTADDYDPAEDAEVEDTAAPPAYTFKMAQVVGSVNVGGRISLYSNSGARLTSLTPHFDEFVNIDTLRQILVEVTVPNGFSNYPGKIVDTIVVTQPAKLAPGDLDWGDMSDPSDIGIDLEYTMNDNADLTEVGYYYSEDTGGTETINTHTNQMQMMARSVVNNKSILKTNAGRPALLNVPSSDVEIIDSAGNTVSSSAYDFIESFDYQPPRVNITDATTFGTNYPMIVGQTSTATQITDALTASGLASSGTQVVVEGTPADIEIPVKTSITGLTPDTSYVAVGYATNSVGTSYTNILRFRTKSESSQVPRLPLNKLFIVPTIASTDTVDTYHVGYGDFKKADNNYYFTVFGGGGGFSSKRFDPSSITTVTGTNIDGDDFVNQDAGLDNITGRKIDVWKVLDADVPNNAVHTITASAPGALSNSIQIVKGTVSGTRYTSNFTPTFAKTGTGVTPVLATADVSAYEYNDSPTVPAATYKVGPHQGGRKGIIVVPFGTHTNNDNYGVDTVGSLSGTTTTFGQDNLGSSTSEPTFFNASDWSNLGIGKNSISAFNTNRGDNLDLTNNLSGANSDPGQYNHQNLIIYGSVNSNDPYWASVLSYIGVTKTGSTFPFDGSSGGFGSTRTVNFSSTKYFTIEWDDGTYMIVSATRALFYEGQGGSGQVELSGEIVAGNGTIDKTEGFTFRNNAAPAVKFDATKLDVSITGKTAGTDYDYYICDESPGLLGEGRLVGQWGNIQKCPAIVIECDPYILNNGTASVTHTLNITYNY